MRNPITKLEIRNDSVLIEGYVNAVERNSKVLQSRLGEFRERNMTGVFDRALKRNNDVHVLLNHDWERDLGSTKSNLELWEDSIGLGARFETDDAQVMEDARNGDLVGWSYGFSDIDVDIEWDSVDQIPLRLVKDIELYEVSILNREKSPAYEGTLITARSDDSFELHSEPFFSDLEVRSTEKPNETREEPNEDEPQAIDYSKYEDIISSMKGEK